jgi:hypothetical protein
MDFGLTMALVIPALRQRGPNVGLPSGKLLFASPDRSERRNVECHLLKRSSTWIGSHQY